MQTGSGSGGGGGHAAQAYRGLRSHRAGSAALGEINVTPLVDVVLVLLLIFMVTAPMMSRGVDVSLPVAKHIDSPRIDRVTVTVRADGQVWLGDRPVHIQLLEEKIRGVLAAQQMKVVYLRADENLRYGKVIEVVDVLKKAGVEQIGFVYVTPQEKKAGS